MEYDEEENDATDSAETSLSSRKASGIKNDKHRGTKQAKKNSPDELADKLQSNHPVKTMQQYRPLNNSMPKQCQQDDLVKNDKWEKVFETPFSLAIS